MSNIESHQKALVNRLRYAAEEASEPTEDEVHEIAENAIKKVRDQLRARVVKQVTAELSNVWYNQLRAEALVLASQEIKEEIKQKLRKQEYEDDIMCHLRGMIALLLRDPNELALEGSVLTRLRKGVIDEFRFKHRDRLEAEAKEQILQEMRDRLTRSS